MQETESFLRKGHGVERRGPRLFRDPSRSEPASPTDRYGRGSRCARASTHAREASVRLRLSNRSGSPGVTLLMWGPYEARASVDFPSAAASRACATPS